MAKPPSPIRIDGDTAYIALTMGLEAAIDINDVPLVSDRRWRVLTGKAGNYYAVSGQHPRTVLLHRLLMGTPKEVKIDHKDGNGLNRLCPTTPSCPKSPSVAQKVRKMGGPAPCRNLAVLFCVVVSLACYGKEAVGGVIVLPAEHSNPLSIIDIAVSNEAQEVERGRFLEDRRHIGISNIDDASAVEFSARFVRSDDFLMKNLQSHRFHGIWQLGANDNLTPELGYNGGSPPVVLKPVAHESSPVGLEIIPGLNERSNFNRPQKRPLLANDGSNRSVEFETLPTSDKDQQPGEEREQRIGNLQLMTKNQKGPVFGSFLCSFAGIILAIILFFSGFRLWESYWRLIGFLCIAAGIVVDFSATIGLLINLDPLSLWRLL
jgi:hypothetical protein